MAQLSQRSALLTQRVEGWEAQDPADHLEKALTQLWDCPQIRVSQTLRASNHPGSCANADSGSGSLVICNSGDFQVLLPLLLVLEHFWGRKVPRSEHCRFLPEVWSVDHSIHGSSLEIQVTRPCPDRRAVGSGCGPTYVCLTNCPRGFRCAEV